MSEPLIRVLVVEPEQAPYERQISTLAVLEALYRKHNRDRRPCSRGTRSLSVSNIVTLNRGGERQVFYVNRVGFDECKEFLDPPSPPQNRTRSGKKKKREASK